MPSKLDVLWESLPPSKSGSEAVSRREVLYLERARTQERLKGALDLSIPYLRQSGLHSRELLTERDIDDAIGLTESLAPVHIDNWHLHAHVRRTGKFARFMLEELQDRCRADFSGLDPGTVQVQGIFHDMGRILGQHAYLRTEFEGDAFLKRLGLGHLAVDTVRVGHRFRSLQELSPVERLITMADMCSGVDRTKGVTSLQPFEEKLQLHEQSRKSIAEYSQYIGKPPIFASSFQGLLQMERGDHARYTDLYTELYAYFKSLGVDPSVMRRRILEKEETSEPKMVVFDVGGVLIPDPDEADMALFREVFCVSDDQLTAAWKDLVPQLQTGRLSVDAFWKTFASNLGKSVPAGYERFFAGNLATTIADPAMNTLIDDVRRAGYRVGILSNTVPPAADALKNSIYRIADSAITSPEIGVTKASREAFDVAALKFRLPPQACVFIDNIQKYVDQAQGAGMKAVRWQLGEHATDDLRQALREAKVKI